jgi:hypothetical protein
MAKCATCGTMILFGGKKAGDLRFCSDKCLQRRGALGFAAAEVPPEIVQKHAESLHDGDCPKCGGQGPVDIHTSYRVWSAIILTSWQDIPELCCRACGNKSKTASLGYCLLFGWWGGHGLIVTPLQVTRNIVGLFRSPDPTKPSAKLVGMAKLDLAAKVLKIRQQGKAQP